MNRVSVRHARRAALTRLVQRFAWVSALAIALVFGNRAADACAFDMVKPEKTVIDRIVESDWLVLARPAAGNVFAFQPIETLRGPQTGISIGELVDSTTRRRLATAPSDSVLFGATAAGGWVRIAYIDDGIRPVLDMALEHEALWRSGLPESRIAFIESLQHDPDPRARALVIGELDKVPYDRLRSFDLQISSEELLSDLWTTRGYPYQAIRVVLLGLTGTPEARAEILDYIDRVETWNWANNLGAFAAALIELDGAEGVRRLAEGMLADPGQPLDKIEQLVMALSVHHALSDEALQSVIDTALRDLVQRRPETAAAIARQFTLRSNWSQTALLEPLVRARKIAALADLLTVSVYLGKAREAMTDG